MKIILRSGEASWRVDPDTGEIERYWTSDGWQPYVEPDPKGRVTKHLLEKARVLALKDS